MGMSMSEKMSKNVEKMSKNCPERLKTQILDIFWTIFAYLVHAFVWWPCPMLLPVTNLFQWDDQGGTPKPCDLGWGQQCYRAHPPKPFLETSKSGIGLVSAHFLQGKWQGEDKNGGGAKRYQRWVGGCPKQILEREIVCYVFPSPEWGKPKVPTFLVPPFSIKHPQDSCSLQMQIDILQDANWEGVISV